MDNVWKLSVDAEDKYTLILILNAIITPRLNSSVLMEGVCFLKSCVLQ